ncbi:glutamine--fructose-6-phosphate transaminase (isomerizing) [Candidatus Peregrinibacteria bacterium CG10_big_fil_rev_8_21_14_0_10_49_24]|nr:MAG: glutamine--fructose-6-phosphate transaminase (isomerizing) [Candidatus Peregrinibacteria bacterium CG11_big_fil_rev_8_21_14_0_20_49_14]PIR50978.1 MAG: glutamine--fructose-6-phosphate transaminase (isomerizing) [Candidatus Peregrinibacteria bacterium CG10_big_fil_rev_8_21_14_0_10_49_24]PJA67531.1 MAG: glutamine--fructose-6-phosphate transaminase (isomerizing) [Candidatus Peregrinibacteria bacterium CG_4_9_14_3_um_filter_49_12]
MCGIFGYVGSRINAGQMVIDGIKHLEYRGYDSWGVACKKDNEISVAKEIGKISGVNGEDFAFHSSQAIAHTRWATHGGVTELNAHPHLNEEGTIAVVHNGIIENYTELRDELKKKGHIFLSETDSEIIPHLIEEELTNTQDFASAVRRACQRFEGRYALLAMDSTSQTLVAARTGSPLIVGVSPQDGYFIASDIPAFMDYTRTVQYLDDGEMVVTDGKSILFTDIETGEERPKREIEITWTIEQAQKGDFEHYMLKEIMEQKDSIARAVNQDEDQILTLANAIRNARGTFLVGCGTAGKACMASEYFFSVIADHHVNFAPASEFKLYHHFLQPESLLIVVSQSGETADVLEAMKVAKSKGAKVLAIVNVEGSTIEREADYSLLINAGPERAVASTKALTGQLAVLMLIAYAMADKLKDGKTLLLETAAMINDMLNPRYIQRIQDIAELIKEKEDLYIIGKSWNYPMALESAIKIQEVSYIHAEGFAGGELKHGPIALIEEGTPCIALVGNDEVTTDILSNTIELKARGAHTIGVAPERSEAFDEWLKVPDAGTAQALVNIIPIQILSYFLAVKRGKNPDMPRNLAKSVTVK